MIKNLPKEKRDRLILIVISTLIVLVTLWQGVISMQQRRLVQLDNQQVDEEVRVSSAQRLVQSVEEIESELAARQAELKVLESEMASGDMYSWIITKVNQFKVGYDVEIPQFSREVPTDVGVLADFPYKAALFNIRGKAFYHDLGRFIADFENNFPLLRVQNIDLEPAGSASAGAVGAGDAASNHPEKLAFRMEIVTLINPNAP